MRSVVLLVLALTACSAENDLAATSVSAAPAAPGLTLQATMNMDEASPEAQIRHMAADQSDHAGHGMPASQGDGTELDDPGAHAGHAGQDAAPSSMPADAIIETQSVEAAASDPQARAYFTDTVLVRHDGAEQRFYSDILAGKTVVISFTFTSCPDACPLINAQLRKVQDEMGDQLSEDIRFVSITVDPETDTPDVLSAYRRKFKAQDHWAFYTGSPEAIGAVSGKLGNILEKEQHLTNLIVGNVTTARWRKVPSHLPPNVIAAQIIDIANDTVG